MDVVQQEQPPRTRRHHLIAGVLFLGIALWLTWPQAAILGSAIAGGPIAESDGWQKVWNMWWVRTALLNGKNPLYTDLLFWPQGAPLGFQPIDLTNSLLAAPVLLTAGPLAAYGVAAILCFALSGWLTYLLALRVAGSWPGALAAGLVVETAPSHLVRFLDGQLEHVAIQWIALYMLALVHATERPTLRSGLWLAFSAALVAYTNWYHALFVALLTATWVICQAAARRQLWPIVRPWLVAIPVLLVLLSPILAGFFTGLSTAAQDADHWRYQAQLYSADLADLALPSANHPLWGAAVTAYQQRLHPESAGWVVTPGYVALALGAVGLILNWRAAWRWGLLAAVLLTFMLGTSLWIDGRDTGLPLPIASLVAALPGLSFGHRRFIASVAALIPLAVVVAFGVRGIEARLRGHGSSVVLVVLLALGLFENAPPAMRVFFDDTSPIYATLRHDSGPLLIVPLPVPGSTRGLADKSAALRAQMIHGRPISGGYVARPPDYPLSQGAPLIGQLNHRSCEPPGIVPDTTALARSALAYYGFTQIVLHTDRMSPRQRVCAHDLLETNLALTPSRVDGPIMVYDVPPATPQSFIFLGRGWHSLEQEGERAWRWMGAEGEVHLVNADQQPHIFAVHIRMGSYQNARLVRFQLDRQPAGSGMIATHPARTYSLFLTVAPGEHTLTLATSVDREPAGRDVSVSVESMTITQIN